MQNSMETPGNLKVGDRVHFADPTRTGTIKYIGLVQGNSSTLIGVDWDNGSGKNDGSVEGVQYFQAKAPTSGSFLPPAYLTTGISFTDALCARYKVTIPENDEAGSAGMHEFQDKLSNFEGKRASLRYMGISNPGSPGKIKAVVQSLQELDLAGNLISEWKDIEAICEMLPYLLSLNLSCNLLSTDISGLSQVKMIRTLVLSYTGMNWTQVERLKYFFPVLEQLNLAGNRIGTIETMSSSIVQEFNFLRILNLEENNIGDWNEILKLSFLRSLEILNLRKNKLKCVYYPDGDAKHKLLSGLESEDKHTLPFRNLRYLNLGNNDIQDVNSIDSLNLFPKLVGITLFDNPITDPGSCYGIPVFELTARLPKVKTFNGDKLSARDRKKLEIKYVRHVMSFMSKTNGNMDQIKQLHPRFAELKDLHGIKDERYPAETSVPGKDNSGSLITVKLMCVGPSIGKKAPLTEQLCDNTTIASLKSLCERLFGLTSVKTKLFLQGGNARFARLLDDQTPCSCLFGYGIRSGSTILVTEQ